MYRTFHTFLAERILSEQISFGEIKQIATEVAGVIHGTYPLQRVLLARNVIGSPSITQIDLETGKEKPVADMFSQNTVFRNFRTTFGTDLQHAEVLKFEFSGYKWFMLMLGFTKEGKRGVHMSYQPDVGGRGLITKVGKVMEDHGYVVFPAAGMEKTGSLAFFEKLIDLFRPSAGMSYGSGMWAKMRKGLEELHKEFPQEFAAFEASKKKLYGSSVSASRKMDLPANLEVTLADGTATNVGDLKVGDKVFYPLKKAGVYFSQWSERGESLPGDDELKTIINSSGNQVFACDIPVERVIYTARMLPAGFSTHVFENEILVWHPPANVDARTHDPALVCTMTKV